jgi:hypothetical protein
LSEKSVGIGIAWKSFQKALTVRTN